MARNDSELDRFIRARILRDLWLTIMWILGLGAIISAVAATVFSG